MHVKLQIPLSKELRDEIEAYVRSQGFSSIQEFTRVIYKTVLEDELKFYLAPKSYQASKLNITEEDYSQYSRNKGLISLRKYIKENPLDYFN